MKKIMMIAILMSLIVTFTAEADQMIDSQIEKVTLYLDRAMITRVATTKIAAGMQTLLIEMEAFQIDPDAVSARVFGAGEVYGVQYREDPIIDSPQEGIRLIKEQIKDLEKQKQAILDKKNVLEKQTLFLDALVDFSKTQLPHDIKTAFPKTDELQKTLSFLGSSYQKIFAQQQDYALTVDALDRQIVLLNEKLRQLQQPAKHARKLVEVIFRSQKDQEIKIEADYLALNARWTPLYKASVTDDLDRVNLTMFANITQKTGENWPQVALSLSNTSPLKGGHLPALHPWIIDIPRRLAKQQRAYAPSKTMPALESVEMKADATDLEEEAGLATATARRRTLAFEYVLPRPLDVESREKESIIPIQSKTLKGDFYHWVVPKRTPRTFLACEAQADVELLAGPMNIYFDGQYVGKTRIADQKAGDAFRLSLGADQEVLVKRERLTDKVKETYFGKIDRNTVVRIQTYRISVTNQKNKPVNLKVLDHIPVARTDKLKVEDLKMTPAPTVKDYQKREGVMLWELKLAPKAKKEINIEFVVIHPKDATPFGL
jgi:uncharacterized protein (TIGR02231 family)